MPRKKKIKTEEIELNATEPIVEQKNGKPRKFVNVKLLLGLMLFFFFAGMLFFGGYFYFQYKKALKKMAVDNRSESQVLAGRIREFVELPDDEEPTIAEVKDLEKLKGQTFFSSAQNGDKVLIYAKNKKAVLYRPGTEKIIEVASLGAKIETKSVSNSSDNDADVVAPDQTGAVGKEGSKEETVNKAKDLSVADEMVARRIVVYNGTKTNGLAAKLGKKILSEVVGVEISKVGNAVSDYSKTLIVDLSGNNAELVQRIMAVTGGEIGELPASEKKPEDGDILVIGGEK